VSSLIPGLIRTEINLLPPAITQVRVMETEGPDLQADGGTHMANTSEVGSLQIVDYRSKERINKWSCRNGTRRPQDLRVNEDLASRFLRSSSSDQDVPVAVFRQELCVTSQHEDQGCHRRSGDPCPGS